jgi:16S rRNA processing protein RimM
MPTDRIVVGRVGAAHGIRGDVRVKSFTADPLALGDYGPLTTPEGRRLTVARVRDGGTVVIVGFAEIKDRTAAEALNGTDLLIDRNALPPSSDADDFYVADLIGLVVDLIDGVQLGIVNAVQDFGAGDLLDVIRPDGSSVYVPFTRAVVPTVDLAGGRLVVDPPPGLLDASSPDEDDDAESTREGSP